MDIRKYNEKIVFKEIKRKHLELSEVEERVRLKQKSNVEKWKDRIVKRCKKRIG